MQNRRCNGSTLSIVLELARVAVGALALRPVFAGLDLGSQVALPRMAADGCSLRSWGKIWREVDLGGGVRVSRD